MTENAAWGIGNGVGLTALLVAAARAVESGRAAPLLRDPYAEAFVRAAPLPSPLPTTPGEADSDPSSPWSVAGDYVAVRSRFFDDFFAAAAPGGAFPDDAGIRQAVILAAGLDTRAFRLEWPDGMTVYELDAPLVLSFKDKVLAESEARASAGRRTVATDLRGDWPTALRGAGFDPARPTAWLAEGLMPYLTDEGKNRLLSAVHELSAPGSQIAVEHLASAVSGFKSSADIQEMVKRIDVGLDIDALMPDDQDHDLMAWLRAVGWSVDVNPIAAAAERYGRPLGPALPDEILAMVLVTARKPGQPDPAPRDARMTQ